MLIGAADQNLAGTGWGALNASIGPLTCRRSYNGSADFPTTHGVPPTFVASNAHIDAGLGIVSIYSFKPDIVLMSPNSGGSSVLDSTVEAFLDSIPEGHKMILTIWAEADGKARQNLFTVAAWKAAFDHFCSLVAAHGNPDIKTCLILEAYQPTAPGTLYDDMYPGDCFDFFFVDGYTDLGSGDSVWQKSRDQAEEWGVPWGITELGMRTGAVDPHWMLDQARWALDHDAVCLCWFNSNSGGVTPTPGTGVAATASAQAVSVLLRADPEDFTN